MDGKAVLSKGTLKGLGLIVLTQQEKEKTSGGFSKDLINLAVFGTLLILSIYIIVKGYKAPEDAHSWEKFKQSFATREKLISQAPFLLVPFSALGGMATSISHMLSRT